MAFLWLFALRDCIGRRDMFTVIKLEGNWWAVFLVNPNDEKDRYMLTCPYAKYEQAQYFQQEFIRIQQG